MHSERGWPAGEDTAGLVILVTGGPSWLHRGGARTRGEWAGKGLGGVGEEGRGAGAGGGDRRVKEVTERKEYNGKDKRDT